MRTEGHGFGLDAADIEWFSAQWAPGPAMRRDPRVSPLYAPDLTGLPAAIVATCERADFYDQAGACRYMIVTHLFQVLGFVSMEPPTALDARRLRDETAKVFDALTSINPAHAVRGQYAGSTGEPGACGNATGITGGVSVRTHS